MCRFLVFAAAFALAGYGGAAGAPAVPRQQRPTAPPPVTTAAPAAAQVRLVMELSRADNGQAARTVANPVLSALGRNSASVQVTGADLSYAVSLAPEVERAGDRVAVLWTLQLSGALPGATTVNVSGSGRIATGRREPLTELTLRDPKTGRASVFRLYVTATIGDGLAGALPDAAATSPSKP